MKNKIAIASAFVAASSFSMGEIVINDFLSFEGFADMSYAHTDIDNESDNNFAVDQVEINWLFDFDPVTAQIDLEYEESGDDVEVEQAFVTYHLDGSAEGGAITAGRYASMLGFEAFEPTGLYQYSLGYDMLLGDTSVLPGYAQGVKYTQESDTTFFGISLQDEAFDSDAGRLGGDDSSSFAVEVAGSVILAEGLTGFLGGVYEDAESTDNYAINAYVTFETGAWLFAGEVNYADLESGGFIGLDEEVLQFLLMANLAYSDEASVTGRFTYTDHEAVDFAGDNELDAMKFTLAHNYAFTDNLLLVTEVSYVDGEFKDDDGSDDFDGLGAAVELLFSF